MHPDRANDCVQYCVARLIAFLCLLLLPCLVSAQSRSHSGTDFWFTRSVWWDNEQITLYITSAHTTSGKVELNLLNITNFSETFSVRAGETAVVKLPKGISTAMVGHVEMRGVHITSEKPVEVTAHCLTAFNDGTVTTVLPTSSLGHEYFVLNQSYEDPTRSHINDFMVLAVEDNTLIEITSKYSHSSDRPANIPYTIKLNAGEMFREAYPSEDLSGSRIRSISNGNQGRKKIAVFAGYASQAPDKASPVGHTLTDQYYQQQYPVRLWGQEYVAAPPLKGQVEAVYKIVAAHCNTKVSVNGKAPVNINQGQHYQFSSSVASHIIVDKPVSVTQYFGGNWKQWNSDAETIMLTPVEQAVREATVSSLAYRNIKEHYISVTMPTANTSSFRLDGNAVNFTSIPSSPAYSFAVLPVAAGNHTLKADREFNAIAYGTSKIMYYWEAAESYGFAVGADQADNTHQEILISSDTECGGSTIAFSNRTASPVLSWLWHFGDGTTSTESSPTHTYAKPGTYEVTLTTVGNDVYNCNSEMSTTVEVEVVAKAETTASATTVCQGGTTQFKAVSTPKEGPEAVTGWEWHFGDGTTSTEQNPSHHYAAAETYKVRLITSTAAGCKDEVILPAVAVQALPQAAFHAPVACQTAALTFTDNSTVTQGRITGWRWDFGDGTTSTAHHPNHTFAAAGSYKVSLTVTTESGCSGTITQTVVVKAAIRPAFSFTVLHAAKEVQFHNATARAGAMTFRWEFGDGATSTLTDPVHLYQQAGTYRVTLTASTPEGCISSETTEVIVFPLPHANFSPTRACIGTPFTFVDQSTIASGRIISWRWDFGDGSTSSAQHPTHTYEKAGTYEVRLETTSEKGYSSVAEQQVQVLPQLIAAAGQDQQLPYGTSTTMLSASDPAPGVGTWAVVSGSGGAFSDRHEPKAAFTGIPGQTYTLRWAVAGNGCGEVYDEVQVKLSVIISEHLKIPNGFSPNGDGINDVWIIEGIEAFPDIVIKVHNRWGDEVYSSKGYKSHWNGTRNGIPLPDGAYYYLIAPTPAGTEMLKGSLTILR